MNSTPAAVVLGPATGGPRESLRTLPIILSQPNAGPGAALGDEFDACIFEGGPDKVDVERCLALAGFKIPNGAFAHADHRGQIRLPPAKQVDGRL
jgi:hypothetical protein